MNLVLVSAIVAVCGAAKLDRSYLPPPNADAAGGSATDLQAPFEKSNNLENIPKGGFANEFEAVVVDVVSPDTRNNEKPESGLGAPRPSYGSTNSKVGEAAFEAIDVTELRQSNSPRIDNPSQFVHTSGPKQERPKAALDRTANIVRYESDVKPNGYYYAYETENHISAAENGLEADGAQAEGGYAFESDDGHVYSVTYKAGKDGYQPKGDHLPTPPPIPEEILKSLEQNAKDEAAGIVDDGSYDVKKYNAEGDYTETNSNHNGYTGTKLLQETNQQFSNPGLSSSQLGLSEGGNSKSYTSGLTDVDFPVVEGSADPSGLVISNKAFEGSSQSASNNYSEGSRPGLAQSQLFIEDHNKPYNQFPGNMPSHLGASSNLGSLFGFNSQFNNQFYNFPEKTALSNSRPGSTVATTTTSPNKPFKLGQNYHTSQGTQTQYVMNQMNPLNQLPGTSVASYYSPQIGFDSQSVNNFANQKSKESEQFLQYPNNRFSSTINREQTSNTNLGSGIGHFSIAPISKFPFQSNQQHSIMPPKTELTTPFESNQNIPNKNTDRLKIPTLIPTTITTSLNVRPTGSNIQLQNKPNKNKPVSASFITTYPNTASGKVPFSSNHFQGSNMPQSQISKQDQRFPFVAKQPATLNQNNQQLQPNEDKLYYYNQPSKLLANLNAKPVPFTTQTYSSGSQSSGNKNLNNLFSPFNRHPNPTVSSNPSGLPAFSPQEIVSRNNGITQASASSFASILPTSPISFNSLQNQQNSQLKENVPQPTQLNFGQNPNLQSNSDQNHVNFNKRPDFNSNVDYGQSYSKTNQNPEQITYFRPDSQNNDEVYEYKKPQQSLTTQKQENFDKTPNIPQFASNFDSVKYNIHSLPNNKLPQSEIYEYRKPPKDFPQPQVQKAAEKSSNEYGQQHEYNPINKKENSQLNNNQRGEIYDYPKPKQTTSASVNSQTVNQTRLPNNGVSSENKLQEMAGSYDLSNNQIGHKLSSQTQYTHQIPENSVPSQSLNQQESLFNSQFGQKIPQKPKFIQNVSGNSSPSPSSNSFNQVTSGIQAPNSFVELQYSSLRSPKDQLPSNRPTKPNNEQSDSNVSNFNIDGKGEDFGGPRPPSRYDETGYHYKK